MTWVILNPSHLLLKINQTWCQKKKRKERIIIIINTHSTCYLYYVLCNRFWFKYLYIPNYNAYVFQLILKDTIHLFFSLSRGVHLLYNIVYFQDWVPRCYENTTASVKKMELFSSVHLCTLYMILKASKWIQTLLLQIHYIIHIWSSFFVYREKRYKTD